MMKRTMMAGIGTAIVGGLLAPQACRGEVLFAADMDAQFLYDHAFFPSRVPALREDGNSLQFDATHPTGDHLAVLLRYPLLPADPSRSGIAASILMDERWRDAVYGDRDHDVIIGITDGTVLLGFQRSDNFGGQGGRVEADLDPNGVKAVDPAFPIVIFDCGVPDVFSGTITLSSSGSTMTETVGDGTGSDTYARHIDPSSSIDLFVLAGDSPEQYDIRSISVNVTPEPTSVAVLALGAMALLRRSKDCRG